MKKALIALLALVGISHALSSTAGFSKRLSAVDSALTMNCRGYNSVSFQLSGTWNATVKFEGTADSANWITVFAVNQKGGAVDSVATANGVYLLSGNGFRSLRARVSARTSGTVAVQMIATEGSGVVSLLIGAVTGAISSGTRVAIVQADTQAIINMSTATTTQIVALTSNQNIYVTGWDVVAAGTGTIKLVYGTGSNCGTGTTDLTPAYSLVAQAGLARGGGLGVVYKVPASQALCVTTSAAVGMQGTVSYTKF